MPDHGSEGLLSPWLRSQRIAACKPYLRGRILDFGCGSGVLTHHVPPDQYIGIDHDPAVVQLARQQRPNHHFQTELMVDRTFDTIVSLAVIEHVHEPAALLTKLSSILDLKGHIVLTTPHPRSRIIHDLGAKIGVFSMHAKEEHETFLGLHEMKQLIRLSRLRIAKYRRFLYGINQLFILEHDHSDRDMID